MRTAVSFKCPNCGGPLRFDPEKQKYACDYCLSDFSQEELEERTKETEAASGVSAAPLLYQCPSCGAEIVTDETTAASFCFYCHNPVVLSGRLSGEYRPDYVIPFALSREQALERFEQWIRKKRFVPGTFYAKDQVEKLSGVYFPYLLYSCRVDGRMEAEGVRRRTWRAGRMEYTEMKQFQIRREGSLDVRDMARNALKKADRELIESVLPFQTKDKKPFSMAYLSGFLAEKRDMGREQFEQELEQEVSEYARSAMRNSIGVYDSVQVQNSSAQIRDPEWKYALMPVWTLTYQDKKKDQVYYFALNGQTGKICGRLPVDYGKLAMLFAGIFLPVFAALLAVGYWI